MKNNVTYMSGNLADASGDVIVNDSNGEGRISGIDGDIGTTIYLSKCLNNATKGELEKASLLAAKSNPDIERSTDGFREGEFFTTNGCGLNCKKVFHAVTKRYSSDKNSTLYVHNLLHDIAVWCLEWGFRSVSLPLIGCDDGNINRIFIKEQIEAIANEFSDLQFYVYI